MTRKNECQRQDINQLQSTNKILEEQIRLKNIVQINDGDNQAQKNETGRKNDQNTGIKKKIGINLQTNFSIRAI